MDIEEVRVRFDIPYLLQVEDSLGEQADPYLINLDGIPANVYFKKVPGGSDGVSIAGRMIGDRLGNVSQTTVLVQFNEQLMREIPEEQIETSAPDSVIHRSGTPGKGYRGLVVESAVEVVNRFLRVYKYVTVSYWMRDLFPYEIFSFDIKEFKNDGEEYEMTYEYSNSPFESFGSIIEDEKENEIRHLLKNQEVLSLYSKLELDIINKISLGQYSLAVVNAQRLFEIWTKHAARILLEKEYNKEKAVELIWDDGKYEGLKQLSHNFFPQHLDYDFAGTDQYDRWESAYNNIRNKVTHEGHTASHEEATKMYEACQSAQQAIHNRFEEELKGTDLESAEMDVPENILNENS